VTAADKICGGNDIGITLNILLTAAQSFANQTALRKTDSAYFQVCKYGQAAVESLLMMFNYSSSAQVVANLRKTVQCE